MVEKRELEATFCDVRRDDKDAVSADRCLVVVLEGDVTHACVVPALRSTERSDSEENLMVQR